MQNSPFPQILSHNILYMCNSFEWQEPGCLEFVFESNVNFYNELSASGSTVVPRRLPVYFTLGQSLSSLSVCFVAAPIVVQTSHAAQR